MDSSLSEISIDIFVLSFNKFQFLCYHKVWKKLPNPQENIWDIINESLDFMT